MELWLRVRTWNSNPNTGTKSERSAATRPATTGSAIATEPTSGPEPTPGPEQRQQQQSTYEQQWPK